MKIKRDGQLIADAGFAHPVMDIATFNSRLNEEGKDQFILEHNAGVELLQIYAGGRLNMHVCDVVKMIELMEEVYRKYEYERYSFERKA